MDYFEAKSLILFRQRELFKILVSNRRLIHRELHKKVNLMRKLATGEILVVRKQVKSSRKELVSHKLVFKTKGTYRVLEKATSLSYCTK